MIPLPDDPAVAALAAALRNDRRPHPPVMTRAEFVAKLLATTPPLPVRPPWQSESTP